MTLISSNFSCSVLRSLRNLISWVLKITIYLTEITKRYTAFILHFVGSAQLPVADVEA